MKISIDNGDGRGLLDYTANLTGQQPLKITRRLNAPSMCEAAF